MDINKHFPFLNLTLFIAASLYTLAIVMMLRANSMTFWGHLPNGAWIAVLLELSIWVFLIIKAPKFYSYLAAFFVVVGVAAGLLDPYLNQGSRLADASAKIEILEAKASLVDSKLSTTRSSLAELKRHQKTAQKYYLEKLEIKRKYEAGKWEAPKKKVERAAATVEAKHESEAIRAELWRKNKQHEALSAELVELKSRVIELKQKKQEAKVTGTELTLIVFQIAFFTFLFCAQVYAIEIIILAFTAWASHKIDLKKQEEHDAIAKKEEFARKIEALEAKDKEEKERKRKDEEEEAKHRRQLELIEAKKATKAKKETKEAKGNDLPPMERHARRADCDWMTREQQELASWFDDYKLKNCQGKNTVLASETGLTPHEIGHFLRLKNGRTPKAETIKMLEDFRIKHDSLGASNVLAWRDVLNAQK